MQNAYMCSTAACKRRRPAGKIELPKRAEWLAEVKEVQMSRWTKTRATMVVHQNAVAIGRVSRTLRILFRTETILTTFA
jgi:hypothetical protein